MRTCDACVAVASEVRGCVFCDDEQYIGPLCLLGAEQRGDDDGEEGAVDGAGGHGARVVLIFLYANTSSVWGAIFSLGCGVWVRLDADPDAVKDS